METPSGMQEADVTIQNVTVDSMQVNVNGEIKEIKNNLDDLKSLLQNIRADQFKSGDKIYNIGTITNATFSAEIGKKTFNMYLCRKLTEAISVYNEDVSDFLSNIRNADKADWETQRRYRDIASDNIISGFIGVLSKLLEKVFAIGKDAFVSNSSRDYVAVCISTATRTLQLLCFSFVSKLWDYKKASKFEFTSGQLSDLKFFFNAKIELNIPNYIDLLHTLVNIFDEQAIAYPFSEFNKDCLKAENAFIKACNNLEAIETKLDAGQIIYSTAFEAESGLTEFLSALSFLANYKMVSVKDIIYNEVRNDSVQYLHSYTFLGVDTEKKVFPSKFKYDVSPISSDAVLIYKDKYREGLNLFPFIIDVNALTNQQNARICFFSCFEEKKKRLTYTDIEKINSDNTDDPGAITDASQLLIQFNDDVEKDFTSNTDHDVTGLITDSGKFKNLQFNVVYKIFQNAQKEILG